MIPAAEINAIKGNLHKICTTKDMPQDEYKKLLGISASRILSVKEIKGNFSREEIVDELSEIVQKIKSASKVNDQEISKLLEDFDKTLDFEIGDWCVTLPIINITTNQEVKIGNVKLYNFTPENLKALEAYEQELFKNNTFYNEKEKEENIKSMMKVWINPLVGQTCAEIVLKGRAKKVHDIAINEISKALSLIKLFGDVGDFLGQYFGLMGEIKTTVNRLTVTYRTDGKGIKKSAETIGPLTPFVLDEKRLKDMNANGFQKIVELFNKEDKSKLDTRILSSIYCYGKACDVQTTRRREDGKGNEVEITKLGDKLVNITTSIESLLIFDEIESMTNALSERTAVLLASNTKEFGNIKLFMSNMYKHRSAIVHHSKMSFSKTELDKYQLTVRDAILCFVRNMDTWGIKTENDFFYWIEKERISYRYEKRS